MKEQLMIIIKLGLYKPVMQQKEGGESSFEIQLLIKLTPPFLKTAIVKDKIIKVQVFIFNKSKS